MIDSYLLKYKEIYFNNSYYYIPENAEHRPACQSILHNQQWELETLDLIKKILNKHPGNIIHAGTFFGDMLPFFSSIVDEFCYAFEPVLENYIMAKLCVSKNNLTNVILQNMALYSNLNTKFMEIKNKDNLDHGGSSFITDDGNYIINTITIDLLDLKNISIIHLDLEGSEYDALLGAQKTISKYKPTIIVENNSLDVQNFLIDNEYRNDGIVNDNFVWINKQFDK